MSPILRQLPGLPAAPPGDVAHQRAAHPALAAALALTGGGRHVHYVAEGQVLCLTGHCPLGD